MALILTDKDSHTDKDTHSATRMMASRRLFYLPVVFGSHETPSTVVSLAADAYLSE